MKRFLLILLFLGLFNSTTWAGTLNEELSIAYQHLQKVSAQDQEYIKYFTAYDIPKELQQKAVLNLSFWVHSLTGPTLDGSGNTGYFEPIVQIVPSAEIPVKKDVNDTAKVAVPIQRKFVNFKQVAGSETLYWVDIRDYNWTLAAFEKVAAKEPFVKKPWVSEDYDNIRHLSGNAVVRMSWFLAYTMDTTRQFDRGQEPLYYTLLYAYTGVPNTADQYRKIWGLDIPKIEKDGRIKLAVVDQGDSIVSRHPRELAGVRTDIGYHWESSDYKVADDKNDVIENLSIERDKDNVPKHLGISRKADAHEYITTNQLGLQVYFLTDGAGKRVEFADPTIVVNTKDRKGDVRVRVGDTCIVCHGVGINPTKNALRKILGNKEVDLISTFKDYQQAIQKYYLSDISEKEIDDQLIFSRAMLKANGLQPIENAENVHDFLDWYDKPVTLEQASADCGLTVEEFKKQTDGSVSIRMQRLHNKVPYPRALWDNPNNGGFVQAMLLINRDRIKAEPKPEPKAQAKVEEKISGPTKDEPKPAVKLMSKQEIINTILALRGPEDQFTPPQVTYVRALRATPIMVGDKVIANVGQNQVLKVGVFRKNWVGVQFIDNDNKPGDGWIKASDAKIEENVEN